MIPSRDGTVPTVLTVEDDAHLRKTICRVLATAGYRTIEAENGKVGLEIIFRTPPDLVITDVLMPEIDGIQMIRQVRAFFPKLPIIALSGSDTAWAAAQTFGWTGASTSPPLAQAREAGVDITIGKPFEIDLLLDAAQKLLSRSARAAEVAARRRSGASDGSIPAIYHVKLTHGSRWGIFREGVERAIARSARRDDAVFLAQQIATRDARARVLVYDSDGLIETHKEFGHRS
jgi:DNA-binding response OmpR family regulator